MSIFEDKTTSVGGPSGSSAVSMSLQTVSYTSLMRPDSFVVRTAQVPSDVSDRSMTLINTDMYRDSSVHNIRRSRLGHDY
jgi:hypothetical protein